MSPPANAPLSFLVCSDLWDEALAVARTAVCSSSPDTWPRCAPRRFAAGAGAVEQHEQGLAHRQMQCKPYKGSAAGAQQQRQQQLEGGDCLEDDSEVLELLYAQPTRRQVILSLIGLLCVPTLAFRLKGANLTQTAWCLGKSSVGLGCADLTSTSQRS